MSKRKLMYLFAPFFLSGCSYLGYSKSPVATENVGEVQVATMAATQRAIIVSRGADGRSYNYCAEPPPDAYSKLTESISAAIKASAGENDLAAPGATAASLANSIDKMYSRSLAVQFFRDASFSLCQAHLIGLATNTTVPNPVEQKASNSRVSLGNIVEADEPALAYSYNEMFAELLRTTSKILEKEIRYINYSELVDAKARLGVLQGNGVDIVNAMRADEKL